MIETAVVYWGDRRHRSGWWIRSPSGGVTPLWGPAIHATNADLRRALREGRNLGNWSGPIRIERTREVWIARIRWRLYLWGIVRTP